MSDEHSTPAAALESDGSSNYTPKSYDIAPEDAELAESLVNQHPVYDVPGNASMVGNVKLPSQFSRDMFSDAAASDIRIMGSDTLRSYCSSTQGGIEGQADELSCAMYVRGAFETLYTRAAVLHVANPEKYPDVTTCVPAYVDNVMIVRIVEKHLEATEDQRGLAGPMVEEAVVAAFPECFRHSTGMALMANAAADDGGLGEGASR